MAAGALAGILIKLAVAVLQYYQGRADYRDKVLLEEKLAKVSVKSPRVLPL